MLLLPFPLSADGRALWGALVRHCRDWTRLASIWMRGDLRGKAARYVQVNHWLTPYCGSSASVWKMDCMSFVLNLVEALLMEVLA